MANIFDDPSMVPSAATTKLTNSIAQNGVTGYLTRTYKVDDELTTSFYSGIGNTVANNDIPIGFGRTMLTGLLVNQGELRADLDPEKVKKVVQFVTTEGPTKGIVGVDTSKLQSVYVGGKKVSTTTTGDKQSIGLKEILGGIAASAGTLWAASAIKDMLSPNSETGEPLPDAIKALVGDSKAIDINSVKGINTTGANSWDLLRYDASGKKWIPTSLVEAFKKSGIGIDDMDIYKDGVLVQADPMRLNFIGTGVTVDPVGGEFGQVNITINSSGGGTDPDPGGGTDPSTPTTCSASVSVTTKPVSGARYLLKRNGKIVGILLIDSTNASQFPKQSDVANYLASKTVVPSATKSNKFTVSASGNNISIVGDTTCKACDIGDWTLENYGQGSSQPAPSGGAVTNVCNPRKPSLSM